MLLRGDSSDVYWCNESFKFLTPNPSGTITILFYHSTQSPHRTPSLQVPTPAGPQPIGLLLNSPGKLFRRNTSMEELRSTIPRINAFKEELLKPVEEGVFLGKAVITIEPQLFSKDMHVVQTVTIEQVVRANASPGTLEVILEFDYKKWNSIRRLASGETIATYYHLGKVLGTGASGVVRKATTKSEPVRDVAIKIMEKANFGEYVDAQTVQTEVEVLSVLKHPNITELYNSYEDGNNIYLVMELIEGEELFDLIVQYGSFSTCAGSVVLRQILEGVAYMHSNGIAHRDLKPENLIANEKKKSIKITDFGSAGYFDKGKMTAFVGSAEYIAPEIFMHQPYDELVDIWSLGVIAYVLLCGYQPFSSVTGDKDEIFAKIMAGPLQFPPEDWDHIIDQPKNMIKRMLVMDPTKRPTAEELLNDPYMMPCVERTPSMVSSATIARLGDRQNVRKHQKQTSLRD